MRNIREVIQLSTEFLEKKGVAHARREAEELLAALLNRKRLELYFDYDAPIKERELTKYREWIRRKGEKEPLDYIIGNKTFHQLKLKVSPDVLIPRHETEVLVEKILKRLSDEPKTVWDLCTGSGCIGLSIKQARPQDSVTLSDLSPEALAIAKENAAINRIDVSFLEGDLLLPFEGQKADVVVCNPPYVLEEEYSQLEEEVRHYEPRMALVGGLQFYERLARDLPTHLNPGAQVFFEIGKGQGEQILKLFDKSHWKQKSYEKDWSENDRFFFLEFEGKID